MIHSDIELIPPAVHFREEQHGKGFFYINNTAVVCVRVKLHTPAVQFCNLCVSLSDGIKCEERMLGG